MAYVTADQPLTAQAIQPLTSAATVRIEPPGRFLAPDLRETWNYRELLYFFLWRDVKVRYKQTVIGVAWVVLQPLLSMITDITGMEKQAYGPMDGRGGIAGWLADCGTLAPLTSRTS